MREFLKGQLDYIYFFYGLSFFLLAFICFTLDKERLRKFPWIFLGLFGLFHGATEWLDMFMIIYGRSELASILNLLTLIASFICLFEFSRIGLYRVEGRKISKLAYLPFLALLPLGYKYGLNGWAIMARYLLGFPAAYFAARVLYGLSGREKEGKAPLIVLSMSMAVYAVFTGFVVPKADFIPASILNFQSFYAAFGVPIQLVRATLALCSALAIWFYSSTLSDTEYRLQLPSVRFAPTRWMIALTLIVFIGAGWTFTNYLDYYAGIKIIKKTESQADSQINKLTRELTILGRAALSMSRSWAIRDFISSQQPQNMVKALAVLKQYRIKFNALDCALLDARGILLISTGDPGSEIKPYNSYASRPYFRDALSGKTGYYFKLGTTYNERVYYVSYPVKDNPGKISAVAVIVKDIHAEPLFQYRLFSIVITFLVSTIAIIFFIALRRREAVIALIERVHSKLEEIDRMKTDFISIVSHELRTPLTSIKNAAGILMKGGPERRRVDEREAELLKIIVDNVERQTRMVNDLLDVSKIEAGAMPVFPEHMDIQELIKDVLDSLKPMAEEKKIDMAVELFSSKKMVYADPEHVRRIMNNLIVNAIKFTPDKGRVTVRLEDSWKGIKIMVCDNGIGISEEDKKNIFNKFYRSCDAEMQERRGCGLGLAITKGLVEAQKGKIWVESESGKGSSFHLTLPAAYKQGEL